MATTFSSRLMLEPADARLINELCDRFESRWKSGPPPTIDEYLIGTRGLVRSQLLAELLMLEGHYRKLRGESPSIAEYLTRFPEDSTLIQTAFQRIQREVEMDRVDVSGKPAAREPLSTRAMMGPEVPSAIFAHSTTDRATPSNEVTNNDRYELLEVVGSGGVGRVYRARDRHLNRELAVKVLRPSHQHRADIVQRFVAEAQIGAQLQHTGIAPVYELGYFADGSPFLAMKLVRGQTFAAMLAARQAPNDHQTQLLTVFEQVCQAVAYAHDRGVVHRDLKPGNIMVGEFGEVQIMDWGFAKVLADGSIDAPAAMDQQVHTVRSVATVRTRRTETDGMASVAGLVVGTPAYMPPEQSQGSVDSLDQRADVFALGAILCEILTGRPPFDASTSTEAWHMSRRGELAAADERLEHCGAEAALRTLARRCLAVEPVSRPADARVVARELADHLASVEARLQQERLLVERQTVLVVEERRRRKLWLSLMAVALIAVSAASIAGLVWQRNQADHQKRLALVNQQVSADLASAQDRIRAGDIVGARLDWSRAATAELAELPQLLALRDELQRDLELTRELDAVRLQRLSGSGVDYDTPLHGYQRAFQRYGLDALQLDVEVAIDEIRRSTVKNQIFAALHDWAWIYNLKDSEESDSSKRRDWQGRRDHLLRIARRINANPAWDPIYDPQNWTPRGKLDHYSQQVDPAKMPVDLLLLLGAMLTDKSRETLWRAGQVHHANDFWLNASLAAYLEEFAGSPAQIVEYRRAALAVRPDVSSGWNNLGISLFHLRRLEEAEACLKRAITLDPTIAQPYLNLGNVARLRKDYELAIENYRHYIRLASDGRGWASLAQAYFLHGDVPAAIEAAREAIRLAPTMPEPHKYLGMYLEKTGQIDAAIQSLERSLELKPNDSAVSEHLGRLHLNAAASRNRVGRHADALAHAESAVKLRPDDHDSHVKLGETLQAMGRLGDALGALRRSLALDSMDGAERLAISSSIKDLEHLISLESRLPGVLAGTVRPTNDVEGVEFARLCFHHGKFASAARLFGEFAPLQLADEEVVLSGTMKQAIVAAALAGSEPANDTWTPDDESRQMFRDQSYGWLSQVLSKCSATIHEDDNALAFLDWIRECPGLDTLRDPDKLACYPVSEQQRWSTLWDDARAIAAIRKEPAATKP